MQYDKKFIAAAAGPFPPGWAGWGGCCCYMHAPCAATLPPAQYSP